MSLRAISIQVSDEAAKVYEAASPNERRTLDVLLSLRLTEAARQDATLEQVMERIGRRARGRGLTPELLDDILHAAD
jgi:hypothetical protein